MQYIITLIRYTVKSSAPENVSSGV